MRLADFLLGGTVGAVVVAVVGVFTRWLQFTNDFWLGLTTGLMSSGLVVIILGVIRAPDLELDIANSADGQYQHGDFRFVLVRVLNKGLRIWRWQLRRPATFCRAELTFGDLHGAVGRFTIDARWSSLPEPVQQLPGGAVLDAAAVFGRPREFINPDDEAALNIATSGYVYGWLRLRSKRWMCFISQYRQSEYGITSPYTREVNDIDARLWHRWLRINRVLRVMLHTRWNAEAWSVVRVEFRRALALRAALSDHGLSGGLKNGIRD